MFFFYFDVGLVVKVFLLFDATTQYILCVLCAVYNGVQRAHLLFFYFGWVALSNGSSCAFVLNDSFFHSNPKKIEELRRRFSLFFCKYVCVCARARAATAIHFFRAKQPMQAYFDQVLLSFLLYFIPSPSSRFTFLFHSLFFLLAIEAEAAAADMQFTVEK